MQLTEKLMMQRLNFRKEGRPTADQYNYTEFVGSDAFSEFRSHLPVGSAAPDFTGIDLATGQSRNLADYWATKDVLIEFGSFT